MIKATGVTTLIKQSVWFVTAKVNDIEYQARFDSPPSVEQIGLAVESFEVNYDGLNESTNKPVIVKQHHSEA